MENLKNLNRYDNIDNSDWMIVPFERTQEGFLKGRAIVTCAGVFTYRKADGSLSRELRLPDEVFSSSTIESLKLKPVTLNHPQGLVTEDDAKKLSIGSLGSNPTRTKERFGWDGWENRYEDITDGMNCAIDMIITAKEGIDAVIMVNKDFQWVILVMLKWQSLVHYGVA